MKNNLVNRITTAVRNALGRPTEYKRADGSVYMTVLNAAYDDAATITIDGPIGSSWWDSSGITARAFTNELNTIPKGRQVQVKINSDGGAVGDALAIYNAMQERK